LTKAPASADPPDALRRRSFLPEEDRIWLTERVPSQYLVYPFPDAA
jgi:hypothetical protein